MTYFHQPVLLKEVLEYLNPQPNQNFIDGTVGGGGHAAAILERTGPNGFLIGLDRDPKAIAAAVEKLAKFKNRIILICDSYKDLNKSINDQRANLQFHGLLLDLGLSSAQLAPEESRGFSFKIDAPLDMRFGPETELTAEKILNFWPEQKLADIFRNYGEERKAKAIAKKIVLYRKSRPFKTTAQLASLFGPFRPRRRHAATKVFQALRIAVNSELETLKEALPDLSEVLAVSGRLAVISYHSLEDRIVKQFFLEEAKDCVCPKEFPECRCTHRKTLAIVTKKPVIPSAEEIKQNPRARSAKLRVAEKV